MLLKAECHTGRREWRPSQKHLIEQDAWPPRCLAYKQPRLRPKHPRHCRAARSPPAAVVSWCPTPSHLWGQVVPGATWCHPPPKTPLDPAAEGVARALRQLRAPAEIRQLGFQGLAAAHQDVLRLQVTMYDAVLVQVR